MTRPAVSVVMPFAGDAPAGRAAAEALRALDVTPDDALILVDNGESELTLTGGHPPIDLVRSIAEHSPAHARNQGAIRGTGEWVLFLDADCRPRAGLLDAYFASPIPDDVGALAGEVVPAAGGGGFVSRYGAARSFLGQEAHLAHPYRPRAAAANLLVRRAAFEQVGGFFEGLRAGEDTDFTWRLQEAGWRLELRAQAWAEHTYRTSLRDLRRQWRGYAAGRAWLARRYDGFRPEPALARALRGGRRSSIPGARPPTAAGAVPRPRPLQRAVFLLLDVILSLEELAGLALSNRPASRDQPRPAEVLLLADRFPAREDPLVELAVTLEQARVQAIRRPELLDLDHRGRIPVDYMEDDGRAARILATIGLMARHPVRSTVDLVVRKPADPPLQVLAPAARRVQRQRRARVMALGPRGRRTVSERVARLAGRKLDQIPRPQRLGGMRRLRAREP